MPQGIPQYDEPQVRPAPIPGSMARADAPLAAFGGGDETNKAFNAAQGLAEDSSKVFQEKAEKAKQVADDTAIYGAAAQLSKLQTSLIVEAKSKQGENAFGIYNPTMDAYSKGAADISSSLTTPEQKMAFERQVFSHQAELDRSLQEHIGTQRLENTKQTIAAASEQFGSAAIASAAQDPLTTKMNIARQRAADMDLAKHAGLSPEAAQVFVGQRVSATHLKVLNAISTTGQDLAAAQYFQDNADRFLGEDRIRAQALVMEGNAMGQAQRAADRIFSPTFGELPEGKGQGPTLIPGARTLAEAEARVREIKEPKVREYAMKEVGKRWEQMQQDLHQQQVASFQELAKIAATTGDIGAVIRSNPDAYLNGITPAQRTELEAQAKMVADRRDPTTDALTWYKLDQMAKNPKTASEFMDLDLGQYRSKISGAHFDGLVNLQGDLKGKSGNSIPTLAFSQIVEDELLKNNIFPPESSMSNEQKRQYAAFRLEAADRFDTFKRVDLKGVGNPTQAQMQDIVGQMIRSKATSNGLLWNTELPAAAVLPKDRILSNESRDDMTALIKGRGKEVSEDKLNRMNEAFQNGNRKLYLKIADE